MARGKRFRAAYEMVDRDHLYDPSEAVSLLKQAASAKFDETVASAMGAPVYTRLGYRDLGGLQMWEHRVFAS